MRRENQGLTPAEWNLMECLWEKAPQTGREVTEYLEEKVGWSRSTTRNYAAENDGKRSDPLRRTKRAQDVSTRIATARGNVKGNP